MFFRRPIYSGDLNRTVALAALAGAAMIAACGQSGGSGPGSRPAVLIALNVPSSANAFLAAQIQHGADLAIAEQNAKAPTVGGVAIHLTEKVYDDNGQAQQAASNVQSAVHDGAVAVIEDGAGAKISAPTSGSAGVPEIVIANGDINLLDPQSRPSLFRLGIANDADASILGAYMATKAKSAAILHDDTESGRDAAVQLRNALSTAHVTIQPVIEVASTATTIDTQVQQLANAKPGAIAIEGGDTFTGRAAAAIRAAGLTTPLFAGQFGEFPAVRATAGAAADGLTFASSRLTSESDDQAFGNFERNLAKAGLGCTDAGVKTAAGAPVLQPDDYAMYAYDAVNLVVAALKKNGSTSPSAKLLSAMTSARVKSANADSRGFNPATREGISDDDIYLAVIHDNEFQPVKDEQLSATLPPIDQNLAGCAK